VRADDTFESVEIFSDTPKFGTTLLLFFRIN
jgi:hypothetical protein